ncbi:TA system VapC family ribonuclease toxin [Nocardia mangyaensis]|uniref:TA system VapC family ribonuclease toxin n=1 Tax=Nocardia mangyaensis TaxID=2213200 RepID=UPI002675E473|nr:TA system VapC family ribonuclease toxin [Nocardia mangyaensis]MDO3647154.1 PIN domain-containing protein [Nocardia mangyaensis]
MKRALLDVNVLLALLDQDHIHHLGARHWLEAEIEHGWASCAITENGFVRILSQPKYPNAVSISEAMDLLGQATSTQHHEFWTCSVSLLDDKMIDRSRLHDHRQLTDAYLLALATAEGGRFVTFDTAISIAAVHQADESNLVVL